MCVFFFVHDILFLSGFGRFGGFSLMFFSFVFAFMALCHVFLITTVITIINNIIIWLSAGHLAYVLCFRHSFVFFSALFLMMCALICLAEGLLVVIRYV